VNAGSSDRPAGRLIQDGAHSGRFNMAADLYLAAEAERTGSLHLRLYTWDQPTLSLGYHQRLSPERLEACRRQGVPAVRRPTGGRAVLHDNELTYALALPMDHPLLAQGRDALLRKIGAVFVAAAQSLDLPAEMVRAGSREEDSAKPLIKGSPLCFDSLSRWEVRLDGRKWIGSAQRVLTRSFLQHGSILLGPGRLSLAALLSLPGEDPATVPFNLDASALRRHLPEACRLHLACKWHEAAFTHQELEQIRRFMEEEESAWQLDNP